MAGYIRQSTFVDGDTITAALFNDEYNQLVNAFSNTSGHKHDGTTAEGPVIGLIGDAGETSPNNKVLIDTTNNYIEFYVEVSSAPVQQLYIADGAIIPVTDNDIDLGTSSLEFKDIYIDGTATIDTLTVDEAATVGTTLGVTGATTLSSTLAVTGATTLSSTLAVTGTSTLTGNVTTTNDLSVGGNLTVTGNATISGNLTFGDADTDSINLSAEIDSHIIPNTNNTYDLGTATKQWRNIFSAGTLHVDDINFNGTAITATAAELNLLDGKAFLDEDDMSSNSATGIASQQSIKAYVDAQVTAQDLDFQGDTGGALSIDLDSESLTIAGGTGLDTVGSGNTVTVNIDSTVATLTGTQTLTNKTLTSPDINTPDIDGGTIDSTVIGGTTPAAGTFTTLTANTSITGTLATAAQPNITSVGTLTGLTSSSNITVSNSSGHGSIELGGSSGGFIDLKTPASDDFDARIIYQGSNLQLLTNADEAILLKHNNSTKLATSSTGVDITGTVTADGLTVDTNTLYVDSTNNRVGIGTASPSAKLEVTGATLVSDDGADDFVKQSVSGTTSTLSFGNTESTGGIAKWQYNRSTGSFSGFVGTAAATEFMTINSSGNVGIGTASPARELELSAANPRFRITDTDGGYAEISGNTGHLSLQADVGNTQAGSRVTFDIDGSEKMRIDSSGNVGIGTTSPQAPLHARNGSSGVSSYTAGTRAIIEGTATTYLTLASPTSSNKGILFADSDDSDAGYITYDPTDNLDFGTAGSTRLRVASSGNVGIKNTSPSALLHIGDSTNSLGTTAGDQLSQLTLQSDTSNGDYLLFTTERLSSGLDWTTAAHKIQRKVDATEMGYMQFGSGGSDLVTFGEGSTEYVRIDGAGQLGVGTDAPLAKFHTNKDGTGQIIALFSSDLGTYNRNMGILSPASDSATAPFEFSTANSFQFTIDSGAALNIDSNKDVGIGTTSPDGKLHVFSSSAGTVTAASDANQLVLESSTNVGMTLLTGNSSTARIRFGDADSNTRGNIFYNHSDDSLGIQTSGGTRLTVDSSGVVLIGTTSSTIDSSNYGILLSNVGRIKNSVNVAGGGNVAQMFGNAGEFRVKGDGDAENTNNSYGAISDERLKENIADATPKLEKLKQVQIKTYNLKEYPDRKQIGVIAQELESVFPSLVTDNDDGYKTVKYSVFVPMLIKAMQEQQEQIEALQSEINLLKTGE